ncbi:Outer membrane lipoprotein carrier protein LolA [hydrothermal vent metagenome]|uniref:Outer-membrane lipoprotein carrier protein n=1 Tax=hydrothermal vent metagenome TaxID=652676 RepID=A0A3B0VYH8_9ZZZZ
MKVSKKVSKCLQMTVCAGLLSCATWAQAQPVLQAYVNNLKTFSADFEQIQPDEAVFQLNKSTGQFQLNRPGQLVWQYTTPTPQKIVIDGVNLWVFDQDLDQVTVRPIEEIKGDIPLSWILYDENIEDKFQVLDAGQRNGMDWYNLIPKKSTYFQSIEVGMKEGEMSEVWMYQTTDNITKVRFYNIESNHVIPLKNFQFNVPEGVDLVGEAL